MHLFSTATVIHSAVFEGNRSKVEVTGSTYPSIYVCEWRLIIIKNEKSLKVQILCVFLLLPTGHVTYSVMQRSEVKVCKPYEA